MRYSCLRFAVESSDPFKFIKILANNDAVVIGEPPLAGHGKAVSEIRRVLKDNGTFFSLMRIRRRE